jgi:hypothetical protein
MALSRRSRSLLSINESRADRSITKRRPILQASSSFAQIASRIAQIAHAQYDAACLIVSKRGWGGELPDCGFGLVDIDFPLLQIALPHPASASHRGLILRVSVGGFRVSLNRSRCLNRIVPNITESVQREIVHHLLVLSLWLPSSVCMLDG